MKKTAMIIMVITIISKLFGFGREITLSYLYGASNISDAYIISITIPSIVFGLIAGGLGAGYIPMYSKIIKEEGDLKANKFTNNFINLLLLLSTFIFLIGLIFTDKLIKIFAIGFDEQTFELAINFTRITLLAIYFPAIVSIFKGYLEVKGNYIVPALIGLPLNFIIILSMMLSTIIDIKVLSVGFVLAIASQVVLMLPFIKKNGFKYKKIININDKHITKMAYISFPIILGISVNQINILVDRTIASKIVVGGISALNYAIQLNGFVQGIFVLSIATVMYPIITKMAVEKNITGFKNTLAEAITSISLFVLPATTGTIIFATPIVSVLFGRGAFDAQAISMTSHALLFYSVGMVAMGWREILSRAFYSMQETKIPMINATWGVLLNIILNFILSKFMGLSGLALSTSIAAIFTTGLLFISLRKKIGAFGIKRMSISFLKILFASLIMGIVSKISFDYFTAKISLTLSLLIAIVIGAIIYFIIIYFMKIEDVDSIIRAIKKKFKKKVSE